MFGQNSNTLLSIACGFFVLKISCSPPLNVCVAYAFKKEKIKPFELSGTQTQKYKKISEILCSIVTKFLTNAM
jgi:hypothetical protein